MGYDSGMRRQKNLPFATRCSNLEDEHLILSEINQTQRNIIWSISNCSDGKRQSYCSMTNKEKEPMGWGLLSHLKHVVRRQGFLSLSSYQVSLEGESWPLAFIFELESLGEHVRTLGEQVYEVHCALSTEWWRFHHFNSLLSLFWLDHRE